MQFLSEHTRKVAFLVIFVMTGVGYYVYGDNPSGKDATELKSQLNEARIELEYFRQAERINHYYFRQGQATQVRVIKETLKAIDKYLPEYFPNGPYTREDLVTMAMIESNFQQYLTGGFGEYGLFQIMPESAKWANVHANEYDVDVNTKMALFVLSKKHQKYKTYKMGIIAYNGVVRRNGKISEVYWDRFHKYRTAINDILRDTTVPSAK